MPRWSRRSRPSRRAGVHETGRNDLSVRQTRDAESGRLPAQLSARAGIFHAPVIVSAAFRSGLRSGNALVPSEASTALVREESDDDQERRSLRRPGDHVLRVLTVRPGRGERANHAGSLRSVRRPTDLNFSLGYFALKGLDSRVDDDVLLNELQNGEPLLFEVKDFNNVDVRRRVPDRVRSQFRSGRRRGLLPAHRAQRLCERHACRRRRDRAGPEAAHDPGVVHRALPAARPRQRRALHRRRDWSRSAGATARSANSSTSTARFSRRGTSPTERR